jgi:hypothetical protein
MGHAFGLGDEYVEYGPLSNVASANAFSESYPNLDSIAKLTSDFSKVKWAKWPYVEYVSHIHAITRIPLGDPRLSKAVVLYRIDAKLKNFISLEQEFFVIGKEQPNTLKLGGWGIGAAFKIGWIESVGTLHLDIGLIPPNGTPSPSVGESLFIIPEKTGSGAIRMLVPPSAIQHMNMKVAPFGAYKVGAQEKWVEYPPLDYKEAHGICAPSRFIAAYEGGGHYPNGVLRPEGICKMRNSPMKFCSVCQLHLILETDPQQLPYWSKRL